MIANIFMGRKKQHGSLPRSKPNRHRLVKAFPPLRYPDEAHDANVPREAREELKGKVRTAHQDAVRDAFNQRQQEALALQAAIREEVNNAQATETAA